MAIVRNMKPQLRANIDTVQGQKKVAALKKFDEPQEIYKWFASLEGCIAVSVGELSDLKKSFEEISELLKHVLENDELQLIPVGSFVIGCVRKNNYTLDAYLHIEQKEKKLTCEELVKLYEEKRLTVSNPFDLPQKHFSNFIYEIEKDPLNGEDYVMFKHINNANKVKMYIMSLGGTNNTRTMNHYTAGIYHSNWLVTSLQG